MDKILRGFLWKGAENANGDHCLVRWTKVKGPKKSLAVWVFWTLSVSVGHSVSGGCGTVSAIKPYEGFGDVDHTIKELMSF
jgi:hypothetical protein